MSDDVMPEGLGGDLILSAREYRRSRLPWLAARRQGLGASETAGVLRQNPWKTPLEVWLDKTSTEPVRDAHLSEKAEWGSDLEAVVARKVGTRHPELGKIAPTPGLLAHPEHPWMLATLDRLLVERRKATPRVIGALEVKTVGEFIYREHWLDGVPPTHIQIQVQQQLAVTGLQRIYVAVLVGGQMMPEPYPVERNEKTIEALITYAGMWWRDHVEGHTRPEVTFDDRKRLAQLWPGDPTLDAMTADDDLLDWLARHADARRRKKEAEEELERAAFNIQTRLQERTAVVDEGGRVLVTWKPQTSNRIDPNALREKYPDVAAAVTRASTTRVLRPKEATA